MISRKVFLRFSGLGLVRRLLAARTRWGMAFDAQKCERAGGGCTKCIDACHAAHNVPSIADRARQIKWIWKEPFGRIFPEVGGPPAARPAMLLCNHCDNPPCVRVCPTRATWKREDGIVMMDWHRCIGCRYCMAACPYGSRSFNWVDPRPHLRSLNSAFPTRTKGVVEKCTFCEERLAQGRPPACVEACPEKALVFGNLEDPSSEVRRWTASRASLRRKAELGAGPEVFYII